MGYKTIEMTTIDLAIVMDRLKAISTTLYHLDLDDVKGVSTAVDQSYEIDKVIDILVGYK